MARRILSFAEAVGRAEREGGHLSVLLGNGFSIDYAPGVFSYDSLAAEAQLGGLSVAKSALFSRVGSTDFETVVDRLRTAARLVRLYGGDAAQATRLRADARVVRNGLADVLAKRHPRNALALTRDELQHARTFLHHFRSIFTLNYDLLLYWVINRQDIGPSVTRSDGFGSTPDGLRWSSRRHQRVHFLHGALHLFVEDLRVTKLSYSGHGPLVDELRERFARNRYPLIVTEGGREEKERRIARSAYLRTALRRLGELDGALFIHGVSMSENDDHVFERIESPASGIGTVYVGLHGGADSRGARAVVKRVELMRDRRREAGGPRLRTRFYDAASACVWREPPGGMP